MAEEKRVLHPEELAAVTGGDGEKTCPNSKNYPTKSCRSLDCPYRSGNKCTLYNSEIPGDRPRPIVIWQGTGSRQCEWPPVLRVSQNQTASGKAPPRGFAGSVFYQLASEKDRALSHALHPFRIPDLHLLPESPAKIQNLDDPGAIRTRGLSLRRSFLPFSSLFPADLRSAEKPVKSGISNELLCSHFLRCSSQFPVCISRLLATANIGGWPFLHPPLLLAEIVMLIHSSMYVKTLFHMKSWDYSIVSSFRCAFRYAFRFMRSWVRNLRSVQLQIGNNFYYKSA